ncbi:MAG: UbiA family prenyltransferase [Actinobacteria bacterium]|nr:UbiA family prenyltransferase [Actinomycetota bacterium]MCA1720038.1 UbiA family prenyltransferase [Actinomycetota bacterium]
MRARALVDACHPEPTAAVTAVVTALAVSAGRGAEAALVGVAFLVGQLSVGWSNDWIDADRDRRAGRVDKPVQRGDITSRTLRTAALAAFAACVPLSLLMGVRAGVVHLLAVSAAWAYNARLKSTVLSWLPYALAFGAIPSIVTLGLAGSPWAPWWATAAGSLLGVGAHLANVLPDLDDDAVTGVRGLPHRLGGPLTAALSAVLLLAATALLAVGPGRPGAVVAAALVLAALITGAGLGLGRREGSRAPFRAVLVVAAVDVALLLARGGALT